MNESLKIKGLIRLECRDRDGNLVWDTGWKNNGITNAGKAALAGLAGNTGSVNPFTYLAVGTSNTAFGASQTALGAEITDSGLQRAAATVSRVTTTVTNDTLQLQKEFNVTGSKTIEEVAMFNAASTGTMLGRALSGSMSVVNGYIVLLTYKIIFS